MQWVRLVAGFLTLGQAVAKRESWWSVYASSVAGVKSWQQEQQVERALEAGGLVGGRPGCRSIGVSG